MIRIRLGRNPKAFLNSPGCEENQLLPEFCIERCWRLGTFSPSSANLLTTKLNEERQEHANARTGLEVLDCLISSFFILSQAQKQRLDEIAAKENSKKIILCSFVGCCRRPFQQATWRRTTRSTATTASTRGAVLGRKKSWKGAARRERHSQSVGSLLPFTLTCAGA